MISLSLVSFNSPQVTLDAIGSALYWLKCASEEYEFIVVDNASSENNVELIRETYPSVKLISLSENIGFARAHNIALQSAVGEIFVIVNSDVVILNDVFSNMVRLFDSDLSLAAIGPRIEEIDGSLSATSREMAIYSLVSTSLSVFNAIFPLITRDKARNMPRWLKNSLFSGHESATPSFSSRYVEWVDGMFVAFSKNHLREVGLFDSFYFFDHEIGDLLNRLRDSGGKLYYDSDSWVRHLGGYSRKRNPKIIRASLIGYLHYIFNNRRSYFHYIALEVFLLSAIKFTISIARRDSAEGILWKEIFLDTLKYWIHPIHRRFTIAKLGE